MNKFCYEITDFKETPQYRHLKLMYPEHSDYRLSTIAMGMLQETFKTGWFIYDERVVNTMCIKDGIKENITSAAPYELTPSHNVKENDKIFEGIYDIWLRNMKNVAGIRIVSKVAGVLYEVKCNPVTTTEFQIPLGFYPGSPVTHWSHRPVCTFIPVRFMGHDQLYIEILSDKEETGVEATAAAELYLSTILFTHDMYRSLLRCANYKGYALQFYIGSKVHRISELACMKPFVKEEASEKADLVEKKKKWWQCFTKN